MDPRRLVASVGSLAVVALVGCSGEPSAPPTDTLEAQLRQEAQAIKAQNENQDTDIGVTATWEIASVAVVPASGDEGPTRGTIVFHITARTQDTGGQVQTDEFDKTFNYTFNTTLQKWIFDLE